MSSDVLVAAVEGVWVIIALFTMYRALDLRRVLVDRPYRTRALWTAIGASSVVSFFFAAYIDSVFGDTPTTMEGVVAEGVVWGFTFIALYGWVAVNVNVAIAADFFHRDVLLWKKGGGIAALVVVFLAYALASLPPWWFSPSESAIGSDIVTVLFALAALYAAVALAVTYRRIADRRIKTYTMWVLLSILGVLLLIVSPSVLIPVPAVIWIYCMYRSVGSLAIRTRNLGQ